MLLLNTITLFARALQALHSSCGILRFTISLSLSLSLSLYIYIYIYIYICVCVCVCVCIFDIYSLFRVPFSFTLSRTALRNAGQCTWYSLMANTIPPVSCVPLRRIRHRHRDFPSPSLPHPPPPSSTHTHTRTSFLVHSVFLQWDSYRPHKGDRHIVAA